MFPCRLPLHRSIIAVDIENSTSRTDVEKALLREQMYTLLEKSLDSVGITDRFRDPLVDRGDGILVLVRPVDEVPKALLLNAVVPTLAELLHQQEPGHRYLRLRAAIHAGEVQYDQHGCFGEALDITFRLLDAPVVKRELRRNMSPLALVISDEIYRTIVRHGYDGVAVDDFLRRVQVQVAGQHHWGWIKRAE